MVNRKDYIVEGMHCGACSAAVERVVGRQEGVVSCQVNLMLEKMVVEYDQDIIDESKFFEVVKKAGFGLKYIEDNRKVIKPKAEGMPFRLIIALVLAGVILYISMGQMLWKDMPIAFFLDLDVSPIGYGLYPRQQDVIAPFDKS